MNGPLKMVAVSLTVLLLGAGCRSMTGHTLGENVDNKTIQAEVKAKLAAEHLQNLTWVGVNVNDGTVYLTGNAETAEQKAQAAEVARHVNGVKKVVNNIQVVGPKTAQKAPKSTTVAPSASPSATAPQTIAGEVTRIDATSGLVTVQTADGTLELHVPPGSLQNLKVGDRVNVDVSLRPAR
jgi:virulence-associated protein VapD